MIPEKTIAMLSSVLNSDRAIMVNIMIIRIFTKIRNLVSTHHEIVVLFLWQPNLRIKVKVKVKVKIEISVSEESLVKLTDPSLCAASFMMTRGF